MKFLRNFFRALKLRFKALTVLIKKRPFLSFFAILLILFLAIFIGNTIFKTPIPKISEQKIVKDVNIYTIGEAPRVEVEGKVEKNGVIVIAAQTPGVVQQINVNEGDSVSKGKTLISLSSNYQGGSTPSLSRQLAQKQFQNIKDTFDTQKDIIAKRKDVLNQSSDTTENLRSISAQSLDETRSLLSLNEDILSSINSNLNTLTQNNVGGVNDATILQTKQLKSTFQASVNGLKSQVRNTEFSSGSDKSPTKLANLNKEIALKQLDLQEKALTLSKEISQIQLNLAYVTESMMNPSTPRAGVAQHIHVKVGESVNPGQPLVTIFSSTGDVRIVAKVPANIAKSISKLEMSVLRIGDQEIEGTPEFISTEAIDGQLYSVIFEIPQWLQDTITDGEFISITLPVGVRSTTASVSFVPLDSVYQTNSGAFLYVIEGDIAVSKKITLGQVLGSDVEVTEGINKGDLIILNRNIISGDFVKKI